MTSFKSVVSGRWRIALPPAARTANAGRRKRAAGPGTDGPAMGVQCRARFRHRGPQRPGLLRGGPFAPAGAAEEVPGFVLRTAGHPDKPAVVGVCTPAPALAPGNVGPDRICGADRLHSHHVTGKGFPSSDGSPDGICRLFRAPMDAQTFEVGPGGGHACRSGPAAGLCPTIPGSPPRVPLTTDP